MKLAKLKFWGYGVLAVGVFTYIWHRYSGWYNWATFPAGPFFMQVALPGILIGLICGAAIWMGSKKKSD